MSSRGIDAQVLSYCFPREPNPYMLVFATSMHANDVLHRLWFTSVPDSLGELAAIRINSSEIGSVLNGSNDLLSLVVIYKDSVAFKEISSLQPSQRARVNVIVIASDIYDANSYLAWKPLASVFVAPTDEHKALLGSFLDSEIVVIDEAIDPISSLSRRGASSQFDGWLVWFGYPESFNKGMNHILPTVAQSVGNGAISGLKIITAGDITGTPPSWIRHIRYSEASLADHLGMATYALLSHYPYDFHINSVIKTDNKALLALAFGVIPICSKTPSYSRLLCKAGLADYLFADIKDLMGILNRLRTSPASLSRMIKTDSILRGRSPISVGQQLVTLERGLLEGRAASS